MHCHNLGLTLTQAKCSWNNFIHYDNGNRCTAILLCLNSRLFTNSNKWECTCNCIPRHHFLAELEAASRTRDVVELHALGKIWAMPSNLDFITIEYSNSSCLIEKCIISSQIRKHSQGHTPPRTTHRFSSLY